MTLPALITSTPWEGLKQFTDARIALGRAGVSQPTAAHLAFQLAHAQARDAVHLSLDTHGMADSLAHLGLPTLMLHSQAINRTVYLQRPDLGRRLDGSSLETLRTWQNSSKAQSFDVAFVVVDGLSPLAIQQNALPLVSVMLQRLSENATNAWTVAPLTVVSQGRVAVGDEVGEQLRAELVVVLIGERPGLSSPDSMGLYITWNPKVGTTDAARNCISNVRPAGLSVDAAALTLHQLMIQARAKQLTGVGLKDDVDHQLTNAEAPPAANRLSIWRQAAP